jgi:DNA adenine methylase
MSKSVVKWVGGKTQIINPILDDFPTTMENYHEPFLGGASVLIGFLQRVSNKMIIVQGNIYASDINPGLIGLYKNIQNAPEMIYDEVEQMIDDYNSCSDTKTGYRNAVTRIDAMKCKEDYYYWIRKTYNEMENKTTAKASACFLFLNKTCFRGLYREGPHGFNVPFGNYKNPEIVNKEHLIQLGELFHNVIFECCDYNKALERVSDNDFVYMDPPYVEEKKGSFVTYTADGFNHDTFFETIKKYTGKCMISNSNVAYVHEKLVGFNIKQIECRRAIHSKNPGSTTMETISRNY